MCPAKEIEPPHFVTRVRDIAGEYAAANGFDAIFMLESQPLIYIAELAVITDAVIRIYDERFPIN